MVQPPHPRVNPSKEGKKYDVTVCQYLMEEDIPWQEAYKPTPVHPEAGLPWVYLNLPPISQQNGTPYDRGKLISEAGSRDYFSL